MNHPITLKLHIDWAAIRHQRSCLLARAPMDEIEVQGLVDLLEAIQETAIVQGQARAEEVLGTECDACGVPLFHGRTSLCDDCVGVPGGG
jgi:hypothetical protein